MTIHHSDKDPTFKKQPELLEYASQFATFSDAFRTLTMVNCQADVIAYFVEHGLSSFDEEAANFELKVRHNPRVRVVNGNLLSYNGRIIAHQVNCKGVMGAGVAKANPKSISCSLRRVCQLSEN